MDQGNSGTRASRLMVVIVLVLVGGVGFLGYRKVQQRRAVTQAEAQLKKGFGVLAADTIDRYRYKLVKSPDHCRTLVNVYLAARRHDRLEWASEACLDNGVETLEVYEGLASAAEQAGHDSDAAQILSTASEKFPKSPEPLINLAKIQRKNKNDLNALGLLMKAVAVAGDNHELEVQTLQYAASLGAWSPAKQLADRLKDLKTDNPELKLLIAQALSKGGDKAGAKVQVSLADGLMQKATGEQRAALKKKYADAYR